jgi:hypothetical protein
MKFRSSLETHKTALGLALDMVAITIARDIKADTEEIRKDTAVIKDIKDDTTLILEEIARLQAQPPATTLKNQSDFMLNRYLDELSVYAELMSIAPEEDYLDEPVIATSEIDVEPILEPIPNRNSHEDDRARPPSANSSEDDLPPRELSGKERLHRAWRHQEKLHENPKAEPEVVERESNFEGANGNTTVQDTPLRSTVARMTRQPLSYILQIRLVSPVKSGQGCSVSDEGAPDDGESRTVVDGGPVKAKAAKKVTNSNNGTLPVEPTLSSQDPYASSSKQRATGLGFVEIGSSDSDEVTAYERDTYERAYKWRAWTREEAGKQEHTKKATENKEGTPPVKTRPSFQKYYGNQRDKKSVPVGSSGRDVAVNLDVDKRSARSRGAPARPKPQKKTTDTKKEHVKSTRLSNIQRYIITGSFR